MFTRTVIVLLVSYILIKLPESVQFSLVATLGVLMLMIGYAGGDPIALPILIWRCIKSWYLDEPMDWTPIGIY